MAIDVICGMEVAEKTAKYKTIYEGKTYYFCGPICKLEFDENPQKYARLETNAKIRVNCNSRDATTNG